MGAKEWFLVDRIEAVPARVPGQNLLKDNREGTLLHGCLPFDPVWHPGADRCPICSNAVLLHPGIHGSGPENWGRVHQGYQGNLLRFRVFRHHIPGSCGTVVEKKIIPVVFVFFKRIHLKGGA